MDYYRLFDPSPNPGPATHETLGDRRDGAVYLHTEQTVLAVNVALATGRPLLVRGPSGCGKSSLAPNVAAQLGYRFHDRVITSRTQARDLLWEIDQLQRLSDANVGKIKEIDHYVRPGVLWWAFDPLRAEQRMPRHDRAGHSPGDASRKGMPAVVLLDEIDKADPDVPNNLLVALGSLQFKVDETGEEIRAKAALAPLVILTTNDERELPGAFLRRCVELTLDAPSPERLVQIGRLHFSDVPPGQLVQLAELVSSRDDTVSTGEFLDTVRASRDLKIAPGSPEWDRMLDVVMARSAGADARP